MNPILLLIRHVLQNALRLEHFVVEGPHIVIHIVADVGVVYIFSFVKEGLEIGERHRLIFEFDFGDDGVDLVGRARESGVVFDEVQQVFEGVLVEFGSAEGVGSAL